MDDFLIWQIPVNLFLQMLPQWFMTLMHGVTELGSEVFYLLFMPLFYWCIDSAIGLRMGAMLMVSNAVVNAFKIGLHWPRPYWIDRSVVGYATETSFGAPSGHAANAASVWGVLAASVKHRAFRIIVWVLIFLIGFSRLVLGAHFLIDVIAGWALGALLLMLFLRLETPVVRWFTRLNLRQQILVAFLSSLLLILPSQLLAWVFSFWGLPESWQLFANHVISPFNLEGIFTVGGTWAGFLAGYAWITNRMGGYSVQGGLMQRSLRYLTGIFGLVVIWSGLDILFPGTDDTVGLALRYLRYFVVGFWVTGLAPLVFNFFKLARFANQPQEAPILVKEL